MDLMKLLRAKSDHLLMQRLDEGTSAEKIIADLKLQFDTFLKDVANLDEFRRSNPLNGVKCLFGDVLLEDEYGITGKSPYLFLRIPGHPGLLLELGAKDTLVLFAATEARPIQRQWNGDMSSQVVFVRRGNPLATFIILELDTIRDLATQQTFVGTRFFENLVEQLVVHLNVTSP